MSIVEGCEERTSESAETKHGQSSALFLILKFGVAQLAIVASANPLTMKGKCLVWTRRSEFRSLAMLECVLIANALLGLVCLALAWQIWRMRRILASIAETLVAVDSAVHGVLYGAPDAIDRTRTGTQQLRYSYQKLDAQIERLEKFVAFLSLGRLLWRRGISQVRGSRLRRAMGKRRSTVLG